MYLLGRHLPDNKILRITLTAFFGIGYATARRLCARLSVHENAKITDLSEAQINQLSAYLSAPGSIPARKMMPTTPDVDLLLSSPAPSASTTEEPTTTTAISQARTPPSQRAKASEDPLRSIVIEADLRRQIIANITHHRTVGSYVGRRHAQGLPVRGQGTRSNALTAKKLNRIERRAYSTGIAGREAGSQGSVSSLVAGLAKLRFGGLP